MYINVYIVFDIYKTLSAKYYQENKERLQKKARERNQNLSKEENKKSEYYKTLSEGKRQNLVEYRKKCYKTRKK